tara:strand:- start:1634 stop:1765 length:132 start_codon:yes stop_codon:yes gene_type:complete
MAGEQVIQGNQFVIFEDMPFFWDACTFLAKSFLFDLERDIADV